MIRTTVAAAAAAALLAPACAMDVDAGDYTTLPVGTNLFAAYYQNASRDALYSRGERVPINARLDSQVGILRGVHVFDLGGHSADVQVLLPFGRLKGKDDTASLGSDSGSGDLLLAAALWFSQPGDRVHSGVTSFLSLPTGSYDRTRPLNLGENRWKLTLNGGVVAPLGDSLLLDLIGDVTVFGRNDDANDGAGGKTALTQKPQLQLQAWLRHAVAPALDLRAGFSDSFGGATKLGGVDQENRQATTKFAVGGGWFFTPTTQLLATWGRDLHVRDGFRENNRVNLRLLQLF
ncbi:transporter [Derxia lacustris]|uniref:transporter n=1 Tax=Derxia lacustris TaxID=764842 RepID=UPI001F42DBA8|nr:transporter [Derxia lacustris]